ncbi:unnamed protein product [Leptosia nina]|uniref:Uncharacterized protein n=1 Tax=Leptosia nina TaxID=320188 RepID=A0AAV1JC19_9NEOP
MPRHEKHKDRGYKSYNPDDFSYWDPYYVDSDAAQKYKRDIDYDVDNPYLRGTTTESSAGAEDPDPEFIPALALTGVFGAAFLILPFLVKKGPNRG